MRRFALVALLAVGGPPACSPYVQRGEVLYRDGRYVEAAEVFEVTEHDLGSSPALTRAQYGLYRGLTFLRLGDLSGSRLWLGYAYAVEQKLPGTLESHERDLLQRGWKELDELTRHPPVPPRRATEVARGETEAPPHPAAAPANGRRRIVPE